MQNSVYRDGKAHDVARLSHNVGNMCLVCLHNSPLHSVRVVVDLFTNFRLTLENLIMVRTNTHPAHTALRCGLTFIGALQCMYMFVY